MGATFSDRVRVARIVTHMVTLTATLTVVFIVMFCYFMGPPRHLMMSGPGPSMPQIAQLLARAYPSAKVPPLVAPAWAVAFLAQHKSEKLGFDLHKFRWAQGSTACLDCCSVFSG